MSLFVTVSIIFLVCFSGIANGCGEGSPPPSFKESYSVLDFIDVNTYKQIDCSAHYFCQIEWYKDGVPFPFGWNEYEVVDMGVSLDNNNQTLTLKRTEMLAKGNYSCTVSNPQGSVSRYLELHVQGNDWVHAPVLTLDNQCNDNSVNYGDNVTLSCTVFVGPKMHSTIAVWYYLEETSSSESENEVPTIVRELPYTIYETQEQKMGGNLLKVTLNIFNVTEPALGTYMLWTRNEVRPDLKHRVTLSLHEQGLETLPKRDSGMLWNYMKNNGRISP